MAPRRRFAAALPRRDVFLPIALQSIALQSIASALLLGVVAPGVAHADVVTLETVEKLALHERAPLHADAAASRAARADVDKAERAYLPNLGLNADATIAPGSDLIDYTDVDGTKYLVQGARKLGQSHAFDPHVRSDLELQLKGNLYDFGRTSSAITASRARSAAVAAERDVTSHTILEAVRVSYLRWLGSFELLTLAAQSASDAGTRRTRVQALITEGMRPAADLTPAQADEALAALELERARGNLRAARLALEHAAGTALPDGAEPDRTLLERHAATTSAATPSAPSDIHTPAAPAASAVGDPVAHALALQAAAANASARAAEHADAPALSAGASAGVHAQNLTPFPSYSVGVGLSIPLWDGGISDASADSARAHASELTARGRAQSQSERERRARAALDGENAAGLMRAALELQSICDKRLHEAEQAYELGAAGIEPIAQARSGLRHAQTEVVLARLAAVEAALALRAGP
jgi:outer membrane protein TolC